MGPAFSVAFNRTPLRAKKSLVPSVYGLALTTQKPSAKNTLGGHPHLGGEGQGKAREEGGTS